MPELFFEVYCGICGEGCCSDTDVKHQTVTISCSTCKDTISDLQNEISNLKDEITELNEEIEDLKDQI